MIGLDLDDHAANPVEQESRPDQVGGYFMDGTVEESVGEWTAIRHWREHSRCAALLSYLGSPASTGTNHAPTKLKSANHHRIVIAASRRINL
jgi:hypothetical protein